MFTPMTQMCNFKIIYNFYFIPKVKFLSERYKIVGLSVFIIYL
jgi:hypothetical protein